MRPQFGMALPKHIDAEKFVRILQTAVSTTPALVTATRASLFAACMKAAQDGLLPDGREAALVTFKTNGTVVAQYMPMIGGILKKLRNSGELATITAQIIHKNEVFEYFIDHEGEHFKHVPMFFGDRGECIGAYALARMKDGSIYIEVMNNDQIEAVKKVSRSRDSGPWAGPFQDEMKKKTVLRRLAKRMPSSTDIDMTFANDDEDYDFEPQQTPPAVDPEEKTVASEPKAAPKKTSSLKAAMRSQVETAAAPKQEPEGEVIDATYSEAEQAPPEIPAEELPI